MQEWVSTFPGYSQLLTTSKKVFGKIFQTGPVPKHVGIIMDGSRRYARAHKLEIKEGHNMGFGTMASILELLYESGVEHATVYAFSIENFHRLNFEVQALMDLTREKLKQVSQHGELCEQYGIRIKILGNIKLLPPDIRSVLLETERKTLNNTRAVLNVCFLYTSRDEMTTAIRSVVQDSLINNNTNVDESNIEGALFTQNSPPLDLLVRTSGHTRLSDFLLWQCVPSSCSIVFIEKLWPEFSSWDMVKILLNWSFNTYWYGNGNGYDSALLQVSTCLSTTGESNDELLLPSKDNSATGYERYINADESDEQVSDASLSSENECA